MKESILPCLTVSSYQWSLYPHIWSLDVSSHYNDLLINDHPNITDLLTVITPHWLLMMVSWIRKISCWFLMFFLHLFSNSNYKSLQVHYWTITEQIKRWICLLLTFSCDLAQTNLRFWPLRLCFWNIPGLKNPGRKGEQCQIREY